MGRRKNGEGSLFQRKDGMWQASYVSAEGKRRYFYAKKASEALAKRNKAMKEEERGRLATGPKQKLEDYLTHWLEVVHKHTIRESTYTHYRWFIKKHIAPAIGHIPVHKLTAQKIQEMYAAKLKEGLKPRSVRLMHAILHAAFENAVKWKMLPENILDLVTPPRAKPFEAPILTPEQAQQLILLAQRHRLGVAIILALITGMRRGEIMALTWKDIDFEEELLYVRRSVKWVSGYGFIVSEPKTKSGRRTIPLPPLLIELLKVHHQQQAIEHIKHGEDWNKSDLVFCNDNGTYLHPNALRNALNRFLREAGFSHMRFHDLRHNAATFMDVSGVSPKEAQILLGHSSPRFTLEKYTGVMQSSLKRSLKKVEGYIKPEH